MTKTNITLCVTNRILAEIVDKAIADRNKSTYGLKVASTRAAVLREALVEYLQNRKIEVSLSEPLLTDDQRKEIIRDYIPRVNGTELAAKHGITLDHLVQVVRRAKNKEVKSDGRKTAKAKVAKEKASGKQANQKTG